MDMQKVSHDSETPAVGQQVITACAFIHQNFDGAEKVFMPKRALAKKFLPGVFELPGGHVEFGEDIIEGLKREIKEEFESEVNVGDPFFVFTYTNNIKGSHSVEVLYFCKFITPLNKIMIHPDDHSEYKWFAEDELDKIVESGKGNSDPEIKAIQKAFELLKGNKLNFG